MNPKTAIGQKAPNGMKMSEIGSWELYVDKDRFRLIYEDDNASVSVFSPCQESFYNWEALVSFFKQEELVRSPDYKGMTEKVLEFSGLHMPGSAEIIDNMNKPGYTPDKKA
jgi:hypothetical protein